MKLFMEFTFNLKLDKVWNQLENVFNTGKLFIYERLHTYRQDVPCGGIVDLRKCQPQAVCSPIRFIGQFKGAKAVCSNR